MAQELIDLRAPVIQTGVADFLWRDSAGTFHNPEQMVDRHLFFTVRMIWNNFMPEAARIVGDGETPRLYRFGSYYSKRYMLTAIRAMVPLLLKRYDRLPSGWKFQIDFMRQCFNMDVEAHMLEGKSDGSHS